nr:MAG TPA_asm: Alpha-L-iduronidase [Caudoviricetes sp.]
MASIDVAVEFTSQDTVTVRFYPRDMSNYTVYGVRGYRICNGDDDNKTEVYTGGGGESNSFTDTIPAGTTSVQYSVNIYGPDFSIFGYSETVTPNSAPTAPPSITVPNDVRGGGALVISWAAASDSDGNLSGYILERSVNGASYAQVYKGDALTYTDTITKGWATVAYRVKAYDSYNAQSGYTTSATRTVINNTAPTITAASTALGTKNAPFAWGYTVSDVDGDNLTVTEQLDGTTTKTRRNIASGSALTFEQTNTAAGFQCLLNGDHTLQVTVSDGSLSASKTATFTKAVYAATITLAKPVTVSTPITAAALSVTGSIPSDAAYKVEATNNALDASPVWQDVTAEVKSGINIIFNNATAAKGAAFNFRITVSRGSSGIGGYIESVSGAFQ